MINQPDRAEIARWLTDLDRALFSIVEGYSNRDRAREAYQEVKAVREEIAAALNPTEKETADAGSTAAMGNVA